MDFIEHKFLKIDSGEKKVKKKLCNGRRKNRGQVKKDHATSARWFDRLVQSPMRDIHANAFLIPSKKSNARLTRSAMFWWIPLEWWSSSVPRHPMTCLGYLCSRVLPKTRADSISFTSTKELKATGELTKPKNMYLIKDIKKSYNFYLIKDIKKYSFRKVYSALIS